MVQYTGFCQNNSLFYFNVPQSVYVANEDVKFSINGIKQQPLYIYLKLESTNGRLVQMYYVKVNQGTFISYFTLPAEISAGSYVLTAYLLQANGVDVAEEQTYIIHVTDGKYDDYATFLAKDSIQSKSNGPVIKTNKRSDIAKYLMGNNGCTIVNTKFGIDKSYSASIHVSAAIDTIFRLFYMLSDPTISSKVVCFNQSNRTCTKVQDLGNGIISVLYSENKSNNNFIFLNINTISEYTNLSPHYPKTKTPVLIKANNYLPINDLYNSSAERIKINQYFFEAKEDSLPVMVPKIKADNEYIMDNYEKFENLELFFKEVILPYKMENESGYKSIFLLTGIEKKWNKVKATLIIDGTIINDHTLLFDVKPQDLVSIKFYRKIETLRNYYGALGRNGIVEVTTKQPAKTNPFTFPNILKKRMTQTNYTLSPLPYLDPVFFIEATNSAHNDCIGEFSIYSTTDGKFLGRYNVE